MAMKKKFDAETFWKLTLGSYESLMDAFNKKVQSDKHKAILTGRSLREVAEDAMDLIESDSCDDFDKKSELALEWMENVGSCLLLLTPRMGELIFEWKMQNCYPYLKRISKIVAPGQKGKGAGGSSRKWPVEVDMEILARIHGKVLGGMSVDRAAKFVKDDMKLKSKDVAKRKYKRHLSILKLFLTDDQIAESVRKSLS